MLWKGFPHYWPFVRGIHQRASSHLSWVRIVIMEILTRCWLENPGAICSITWWYAVETLSTFLALCEGNPLVTTGGFPSQRVSNVGLWYMLCCKREQAVEQTVGYHMGVMTSQQAPIWYHCNGDKIFVLKPASSHLSLCRVSILEIRTRYWLGWACAICEINSGVPGSVWPENYR